MNYTQYELCPDAVPSSDEGFCYSTLTGAV